MSDGAVGRAGQVSTEGRQFVYHTGFLAVDRRRNDELDRRATLLRTKAEYGEAVLRLPAYVEDSRLSWDQVDAHWRTVPQNFRLVTDADALVEAYKVWKPDIVVIDVLAKSVAGADLAAMKDASLIMKRADDLAAAFDATVIITTHPPKSGNEAIGSALFGALTFAEWHVSKGAHGVQCYIEKMKDGAAEFTCWYALKQNLAGPPIVGERILEAEVNRRTIAQTGPDPMVETIKEALADGKPHDLKDITDFMIVNHKHHGIADKAAHIRGLCRSNALPGVKWTVRGTGNGTRYSNFQLDQQPGA